MYKPCFILLLTSLVAVPALAADSPAREQQQQTEPATRPAETKQQQPAKPAAAAAASTFTPSEKVSADSAVSFPVDI